MYYSEDAVALSNEYYQCLQRVKDQARSAYQILERPDRWFSWAVFRRGDSKPPRQGWKIHLSCAAVDAVEMVREVLPALLATGAAAFKLPATLQGLLTINSELAGRSQAGKIITVYPASREQAQAVIEAIQRVWSGHRGPCVLSDIAVTPESPIYLRYGLFYSDVDAFDELGRPDAKLKDSTGSEHEDRRSLDGRQPDWAPEPPVPVDITLSTQQPGLDIEIGKDRYVVVKRLNSGLRGEVLLAVDVNSIRTVVVRRTRRGVMGDLKGYDAIARLVNEYEVLRHIWGLGIGTPEPIALHRDSDAATTIQSHLDGPTLDALPTQDMLSHVIGYCDTLQRLHSQGFVHRDVKLSNAVLVSDAVHLVDFELASRIGNPLVIPGGTLGFIPPEGPKAEVATDTFAFGATIFQATTGISPSRLPIASNRGRLLGFLSLTGQRHVAQIVSALTQTEPSERMSLADAQRALLLIGGLQRANITSAHSIRTKTNQLRRFARRASLSAGLKTREFAIEQPHGRAWRNAHVHAGVVCQGLNIGAAGIVLGLMTLDASFGTTLFAEDVEAAASWLRHCRPMPRAHGLFTGNAGVALALGAIGQRYRDLGLTKASIHRLEAAARQKGDYDLFSGAAGVLYAGCILSSLLNDLQPLEIVRCQAEMLLSGVEQVGGLCVWPSSAVFDRDQKPYYGAAHGAAGSALALAAWAEATGCQRSAQTSERTFTALLSQVLDDPNIALSEGPHRRGRPMSYWCHGTAGLLWCLLQLKHLVQRFQPEIASLCRAVIREARVVDNPTYCHGLSGLLELTRLMEPILPDDPAVALLRRKLVEALRLSFQRQAGSGFWSSEHPQDVTPDLWIGFLGPATALALEVRNSVDALLSRNWLNECVGAKVGANDNDLRRSHDERE